LTFTTRVRVRVRVRDVERNDYEDDYDANRPHVLMRTYIAMLR